MKKELFKVVSIKGVKGILLGTVSAMAYAAKAGLDKSSEPIQAPVDPQDDQEPVDPQDEQEPIDAPQTEEPQAEESPESVAPTLETRTVAAAPKARAVSHSVPRVSVDHAVSAHSTEAETNDAPESEPVESEIEKPETTESSHDDHGFSVDEDVPVASSVEDDMSFKEALDTARAEVGAGGMFVWNNNLFATFLEKEWDEMSEEAQADFAGHIMWRDSEGVHFNFQSIPDVVMEFLDSFGGSNGDLASDSSDEVEVEMLGFSDGDNAPEISVEAEDVMVIDVADDGSSEFETEKIQIDNSGDDIATIDNDAISVPDDSADL